MFKLITESMRSCLSPSMRSFVGRSLAAGLLGFACLGHAEFRGSGSATVCVPTISFHNKNTILN